MFINIFLNSRQYLNDFEGTEREKYLLSADYRLGSVYAYPPTHLGIQRIILPLEISQSSFENDQVKSVAIEYGEKCHGTLKRIDFIIICIYRGLLLDTYVTLHLKYNENISYFNKLGGGCLFWLLSPVLPRDST